MSIHDLSNFNYVLIAMALGGIFNIPSPRSFGIAAIAVAISTLLINAVNVFWSLYGIPVFTLPFNFITLSIIYILSVVGYAQRPVIVKSTPEATLDHFMTSRHRFPSTTAILSLPYYGLWSVWQGFDGKWTHKGPWKYAYDFVVTDIDGKTFANQGHSLSDYFAYQLQVISPVRGRVIRVVSHLPDNPIGSVDTVNNWGNFIIIQDERGFFVELSHFAQNSIQVYEGQWIEPGTHVGLCGNSGYSPQPHIHVQVQASAHVGAETIPFEFVHYTTNNQYQSNGLPAVNSLVAGGVFSPFLDQVTTFILDEVLRYQVHYQGQHYEDIEFKVKMALDGTFYFARGDAKLYFGKYAGTFYLYHIEGQDPYLELLYVALASIPMHSQVQLTWEDTLSNVTTLKPLQGAIASLYQMCAPEKMTTQAQYTFISDTRIIGQIRNDFFNINDRTQVDLDPYAKIQKIEVNEYTLIAHTTSAESYHPEQTI